MKLREAVVVGIGLGLAALAAEVAVLSWLEPDVPRLLRREGLTGALALRYAAAYALLTSTAWALVATAGRRAGDRARPLGLLLVLAAAALPPFLGSLALRPSLDRMLSGWGARAGLTAAGAAGLAALVAIGLRAPRPVLGWATAALLAVVLALPGLNTYALQHLPSQLFQPAGLLALATIALVAAVLALLAARLLRGVTRRAKTPQLAVLALLAALTVVVGTRWTPARSGFPALAADAKTRPSILLIVCDTLRADFAADARTAPNLANLARDGITFERAWSAAPWTLPSFASMLTSRPPHEHRAGWRPSDSRLKEPLSAEITSLAELLASHGYATAAVLSNATLMPRYGMGRGFHQYRDLMRPIRYHPIYRWIRDTLPSSLRVQEGVPYLDAATQTWRILQTFDRARATDLPVFVLGQYMDPHHPLQAPAELFDGDPSQADPEEQYRAEVRHFDRGLGELIEGLRDRGVYEELLIVFAADHGEELGEARDARGGPHGHTLHEELLHVPLIVKLPGNAHAGSRVAAPVSLMDVAPTILAFAGAASPASFVGRDLLATASAPSEARVLSAGGLRAGPRQHAARRGSEKVIGSRPLGEPEGSWAWTLYDLSQDPGERRPHRAELPHWAREWSATLEDGDGASSPQEQEGVDIDPALRDALEALGYTEE